MSWYLTDEQEALLGCGAFFLTDCDVHGIDVFNSEASVHEEVTLLNASVSYLSPSEKIRVSVFGRNLTDEEYQTSGLGVANLWSFSTYGAPLTYGVEAEFLF